MSRHLRKAAMLGALDQLLAQLDAETRQAQSSMRRKKATGEDPGGMSGASDHPTADADGRNQDAVTGDRYDENTRDIKAEPNTGQVPDETPDDTGVDQSQVQTDIGITSKETGKDPTWETERTKDTKDDEQMDGSSEHPARADNEKLSTVIAQFRQHAKEAEATGVALVSMIGTLVAMHGGSLPIKNAADAASAVQGDQMAALAAQSALPLEDKQAVDQVLLGDIDFIVKLANERAEQAAAFFNAYARAKQGEDVLPPQADVGGEEALAQMLGEAANASPDELAAAEAAVQGEGGADAGALSPEDEAALLAALAEEEGAGSEEEAVAQLAEALEGLGVTPEELVEAAAAEEADKSAALNDALSKRADAILEDLLCNALVESAQEAQQKQAADQKVRTQNAASGSDKMADKKKAARAVLAELLARSRNNA